MRMRIWGFSLVSRYALCHLLLSLFLMMKGADGEDFALTVLGFPLLYLLRIPDELGLEIAFPQVFAVMLVVVLWVMNSYLWGLAAALIHRRVVKPMPATPVESEQPLPRSPSQP